MNWTFWLLIVITIFIVCYWNRETIVLKGWSWYSRYRHYSRERARETHELASIEQGRLGLRVAGYMNLDTHSTFRAELVGVPVTSSKTWDRVEVSYHRSINDSVVGFYAAIVQGKYYGPTVKQVFDLGYSYIRVKSLLDSSSSQGASTFAGDETLTDLLNRVWYLSADDETSDLLAYCD